MLLRQALILLLFSGVALSASIIKNLPGFPGDLPFKLETGYIGVGDLDSVQLFYYFIESERSPQHDPLLLWLTGGPGCSAFSGLVYEIGPLAFDYGNSSGNKPQFTLNKYSWTKVANIIFLDQPVGTGFSYAENPASYPMDDTTSAADTYSFLRKWLVAHPQFQFNPLYITGDSYSGIIVPLVVEEIAKGLEVGHDPPMNIKGYVLGNPATDPDKDENSRIPFSQLKGLISDELYESTKRHCKGQYIDVNSSNTLCIKDLQSVVECIGKLNKAEILEPECTEISPKPRTLKWDTRTLMENSEDFFISMREPPPGQWCREFNYVFSYIWANDKTVQEALHVREGTKTKWVRCNKTLDYTENVVSTFAYHQDLMKRGYRALIYSGDQDMVIPYVGTFTWVKSLNMTTAYDWEPWFVDGQVAGYSVQYYEETSLSRLTYATVKGAGHTAPEYKPKECLAMITRWLAYYRL